MNYSIKGLLILTATATVASTVFAGTPKRPSSPVIITKPALQDGSNMSRAPFPAARSENDVTPPNGEAFDLDMAPNTPSTTPEPLPPPPPVVAIFQPEGSPGLMPTGRPTRSAAASLEAPRLQATIQNSQFEQRDTLVDSMRVRMRDADAVLGEFRRSENEMSIEARSQFRAMRDEVEQAERALNRSLRNAARANAASWEATRAQLAADYDAYARAVAKLDAVVGVGPMPR